MKRIGIFAFISILFIAITVYVIYEQNPFNTEHLLVFAENNDIYTDNEIINLIPVFIDKGLIWDILDLNVFIPLLVMIFLSIFTTFSTIHMLIEKLFFKNFYENASILLAFRRAFLFSIIFILLIILRLLGGFNTLNAIAIVALLILVGIIIEILAKMRKKPISEV